MRARGPRFAWWLIPVTLIIGAGVGAGVRKARGGQSYVDVSNVTAPAPYVDARMAKRVGPMWSATSLTGPFRKENEMARVWHTDDGEDPNRVVFIQKADKSVLGSDVLYRANFEATLRKDPNFVNAQRHETRHVGNIEVAFAETLQGQEHFLYGVMIIADELWFVSAITFDPQLDISSAFDSVLNQVATAPIKRRSVEARDYRIAMGYGLVIALIPGIVVAFIVSIRRRHAWERQRLADAIAKNA